MLISSPPRAPCSTSHSSPVVGCSVARLQVAVAVRPDLGPHALLADERVVLGNRTVGVQPHDLAEQAVHLLRLHAALDDGPLALRDEERAVAAPDEAAAEVQARGHRGRLVIDDLNVLDARRRAVHEPPARDGGVVHVVLARLGVAPVDQLVGRKVGMERDVEQAALTAGVNGRQAGDRRRQRAVCRDDPQPAGLFGDKHLATGQEGHRPSRSRAPRRP